MWNLGTWSGVGMIWLDDPRGLFQLKWFHNPVFFFYFFALKDWNRLIQNCAQLPGDGWIANIELQWWHQEFPPSHPWMRIPLNHDLAGRDALITLIKVRRSSHRNFKVDWIRWKGVGMKLGSIKLKLCLYVWPQWQSHLQEHKISLKSHEKTKQGPKRCN